MARIASREYVDLKDEHIESIIKVLKSFNYSDEEYELKICPYIAQWLHDDFNVAIESTCVIISELINIKNSQGIIDEIYNDNTLNPPFQKNKLKSFLKKHEWESLESAINTKELKGVISVYLDDETSVETNFESKRVTQTVHRMTKDGEENNKVITVINAVPAEVIVYDNPMTDLPRNFKITWESMDSKRKWTIASEYGGASVDEIADNLISAAYCLNPRLAKQTITAMISAMIQNDMAIIKTDMDNLGVYYSPDLETVSVVDLDYSNPTNEEKAKAIQVLEDLHEFYLDNEKVFTTVFKWGLMSVFSYSMKLVGNEFDWLYLKGTSQAGKTTLAKIMLYIYGTPKENFNDLSGGSFDSPYKIGVNLSKDCTLRVVNEPAGVFDSKNNREIIKNAIRMLVARSKYQGGGYRPTSAFSPAIITANQTLPDDDALINRFYILSFYYTQRKTEEQKKRFKEAFKIDIPSKSPLVNLNVFGRFAIREIITEPTLLEEDWRTVADKILERFYSSIGVTVPEWLQSWEESETINEFDESIREDIRTFLLNEINDTRRKVVFKDEYGRNKSHLDMDTVSSVDDFDVDIWNMINTNLFSWCIPHVNRDKEKFVCLTQNFRKELKKSIDFSDNLKSISQILNWKYKNVKFCNNSQKKCIVVSLNDFVNFVYPRLVEDED